MKWTSLLLFILLFIPIDYAMGQQTECSAQCCIMEDKNVTFQVHRSDVCNTSTPFVGTLKVLFVYHEDLVTEVGQGELDAMISASVDSLDNAFLNSGLTVDHKTFVRDDLVLPTGTGYTNCELHLL